MPPITPCIWFDGNADEAIDTYLSIFPNSRRTATTKNGPDGPGEAGSTLVVMFELDGKPFMALNGGPAHLLTPAISFMVTCENQGEVDSYWDRLLDGGTALQCGWVTDRFGVSWQIVPKQLPELLDSSDPELSRRVYLAMIQMVKIDIGALEAAAAARN